MKNILVVNVNWVGDVVLSAPVFKALKKKYPQARISCMAVPRVKDVLECVAYIDEIIVYDEKGRHRNPFAKLALIFSLRNKRFDAAFILHRSLTRALLVFLAGIPKRVGYDTKSRGRYLTYKVELPEDGVHRSDYYSNIVESFGVNVDDKTCDLIADEESSKYIDKLFRENSIQASDFVVAISPGGNWGLKRWPKENFARLVGALAEQCNAKVIISGAQKDIKLANGIAAMTNRKPIVFAGKTTLKQLIALLKRVSLFISADTGPLHLASSVGTPVIGLFGPTRPEITGPRGKGKSVVIQQDVGCNREPCYFLKCPDNVCMKAITVDDVMEEVKELIKKQ